MNNKALSDFKFIVGGKEFFVHKVILSSRSSVFEAMFTNDMKEKNENEVTIEDIESECFKSSSILYIWENWIKSSQWQKSY